MDSVRTPYSRDFTLQRTSLIDPQGVAHIPDVQSCHLPSHNGGHGEYATLSKNTTDL